MNLWQMFREYVSRPYGWIVGPILLVIGVASLMHACGVVRH